MPLCVFLLSKLRTDEVEELEQREEEAGVAEHVDEGEAGDENEQEGGGRGARVVELNCSSMMIEATRNSANCGTEKAVGHS